MIPAITKKPGSTPMGTIKAFFSYALLIALVLGVYGTIRPYWNKYWIQKDLETAAVYGTKRSEEDTLSFLIAKVKQGNRRFTEEDFFVDKSPDGKVTITLHYRDRIGLFGVELKALDFTLTASATEIKEYF
jgi:hypothetical protein